MKLELKQPLVFEPLFMERVWGGRRLASELGKKLPPGKLIGESWEIVDRANAQSIVRQGPLSGHTLHELWRDHRRAVFGDEITDAPRFPLLAKLLDTQEKLSLQVHPPAEVANALGGEPKSELWYFAAAGAGAEIYAGLRRGSQRHEFEEALRNDTAADLVHRLKVETGDSFLVPSGRLHAIGAGNLVVEISQNSDTTYRVFDWNRPARDTPARQLHLQQSLQSIDFDDFEPTLIRPVGEQLAQSPLFLVEKWDLSHPRKASDRDTFAIFVCLTGAVETAGIQLNIGNFFLMPASAGATELKPLVAKTSLLPV